MPGVGLVPTEEPDKNHVNRAIAEARRSTASVGKFTDKLPKEKPAKNMGKKRKVRDRISVISQIIKTIFTCERNNSRLL